MSSVSDQLSPAQVRLWADLALAVLDVETTQDPRGGYRVVDVAVMICRRGGLVGRWTQWINPEIPIDQRSTVIHGITDETVAQAPAFADVVDRFLEMLTPEVGETLVVVAHNADFDLPILRSELRRAGSDLPGLPVLDTARELPIFAGVSPPDRSLVSLCHTLDIPHAPQHQSVGDTYSLTQAAVALLGLAADQGHDKIADILSAVGTETADYQRQPRHISPMAPSGVAIPDDHRPAHLAVLTSQSSPTEIDEWKAALAACAEFRCEDAGSLLASAQVEPEKVIELFDQVVADVAASTDAAGVATLLGVGMPFIRTHLKTITTTMTRRKAATKRYDRWQPVFTNLGRCPDNNGADLCPDCLDYLPCPLDTWIDTLAAVAVGDHITPINSFYPLNESDRRDKTTKTYYRWINQGRKPMADAGIAAVISYWTGQGNLLAADRIAEAGWEDGCSHPAVAARWASLTAGPGRAGHLQEGLDICDQTLTNRNDSTSVSWTQLERVRQGFAGRLARQAPPAGGRSRRPSQPRRLHPHRFTTHQP